jgi:hypothetical protein
MEPKGKTPFRIAGLWISSILRNSLVSCSQMFYTGPSPELEQSKGRDVAQAVNYRLLTATARVRTQVRSCGICGGQNGTGAGFHLVS